MKFGDIEGKGKIYSNTGEVLLVPGEKIIKSNQGMLQRGWIRYKLGWRTILFKGYGCFNLTNKRVIYIEPPEFIGQIHTISLDHELGDFGGWDYHAHRMRRAAALDAFMFFELPYIEIDKIQHKSERSLVFVKDNKHRYKIVMEPAIGAELEKQWKKFSSPK